MGAVVFGEVGTGGGGVGQGEVVVGFEEEAQGRVARVLGGEEEGDFAGVGAEEFFQEVEI